jgi:hypothetical protein
MKNSLPAICIGQGRKFLSIANTLAYLSNDNVTRNKIYTSELARNENKHISLIEFDG